MKKLKVGIIGLEFGATCHLPAFKKNNKCKIIALCSNNLKKAKFLAKKNFLQARCWVTYLVIT